MANITGSLGETLSSQAKFVPINLLEMQTVSGTLLYFSDAPCAAPSILSAFAVETFVEKILTPPSFTYTASLATLNSSIDIANNSGNTVSRDATQLFTKAQLWGALFVWRLWDAAAESALQTVIGNVSDVPVVGDRLTLTLRGWQNYSEIKAPDGDIADANCLNVFGQQQCGSTSSTPCQNTYGSCTQINRFKGIVAVWDRNANLQPTPYAQTIPTTVLNLRRPA